MTSTEICNLALARLGSYRINSLSDQSKEARLCNSLYDHLRKSVLEAHDWSFARKRATLALRTESYTGWTYAYQLPVDCLIVREILDETLRSTGTAYDYDTDTYIPIKEVEYNIIANATLSDKVLVANKADVEIMYTADAKVGSIYSNKFIDAFTWRLAADLVQPLKGKTNFQISAMNVYNTLIQQAQSKDANQGYKEENKYNSFTGVR